MRRLRLASLDLSEKFAEEVGKRLALVVGKSAVFDVFAELFKCALRFGFCAGLAESDLTGDVVRIESVGSLLDEHMRRLYQYLRILEVDPSVSLLEKIRAFTSATGPLAKGVEALELRARIESLEARLSSSRSSRFDARVVH